MKRRLVYAGASWAAGLAAAAFLGAVPTAALLVISAVILWWLCRFEVKALIFMAVFFSIAFGFYNSYEQFVYRRITGFRGQNISYSGTLTDFKDYSGDKSAYFLEGSINGKTHAKLIVYGDSIDCEPGDVMNFECVPEIPKNGYLFSSLDYYKSNGIYLRTYSAENMEVIKSGASLRKALYRFREKVSSFIGEYVPEKESGMIRAMLFGDKSGMAEEDMTMLYRTGIGHVTSVSGLHLVLFFTLTAFLLKPFRLGRHTKFAVTEGFMLLYAVGCGMPVSVMRAFVMMTLVNSAPLFLRKSDALNSVCIAVMLLTLPNPFVIANRSFLLSVSGALGAGVFAPYMTEKMSSETVMRRLVKNAAYLLCVSAAVTPMSIICFGEVSIIAPISNLVITPLCMAAVFTAMTGALTIFLRPAVLFRISGVFCRIVLNLSALIGRSRFTHTELTSGFIPVLASVLIVLCVFAYLVFRRRDVCAVSVMLSAAIVFGSCTAVRISGRSLLNTALLGRSEVGVIVVARGNHADIIDVNGRHDNSLYAVKYLSDMGITEVNSLVLMKNAYSAVSSYNSSMSLLGLKSLVVPCDTHSLPGMSVCGCKPVYSDFNPWSADYGDYLLTVSGEEVCVESGGRRFECIGDYGVNIVFYLSDKGKSGYRRLEDG